MTNDPERVANDLMRHDPGLTRAQALINAAALIRGEATETVRWVMSKCRASDDYMVHCHVSGRAAELICISPSREYARMVTLCLGEFAEYYAPMRKAIDKAAA